MTNEHDNQIVLPSWIGGTSLTISEIGAIACFASDWDIPEVAARLKTPEMAAAMQSLRQQGIMKMEPYGNRVTVVIDLDVLLPSSLLNNKNNDNNDNDNNTGADQ